jgi:4-amino-4-deoxy-L-arabinose transferase-like glycosyltransferase
MQITPPYRLLLIAFWLVALYGLLFLHLDSMPLRLYDESRLANNALETAQSGRLIVTTYDGQPDMWNTKPPLMIWLQALSMRLLGYNELAVRLPAASAALATMFLLVWFCRRALGRTSMGFIATLILAASGGYLCEHVSRTGDYDALLILWNTAGMLFFFAFLTEENARTKRRYMLLTGLCIALGVLTKSIVGLMFLPGMLLFLLLRKKLTSVLTYPPTYAALAIVLVLIGGYYGLRESLNPGYLKAVWENELGGRYGSTLENHSGDFFLFFRLLYEKQFMPWLLAIPLSMVFLKKETGKVRSLFLYLLLISLSYLLFISNSGTKLPWYSAPILPALSLMAAIGLDGALHAMFRDYKPSNPHLSFFLLFSLTLILFTQPYRERLSTVYKVPLEKYEYWEELQYSRFMEQLKDRKTYFIAHIGYHSAIDFYRKAYNLRGYDIKSIHPNEMAEGDVVMFCEEPAKEWLKNYEFEILETQRKCILVSIKGRKEHPE